jgi:hypothetical protein
VPAAAFLDALSTVPASVVPARFRRVSLIEFYRAGRSYRYHRGDRPIQDPAPDSAAPASTSHPTRDRADYSASGSALPYEHREAVATLPHPRWDAAVGFCGWVR